MSWANVYFGDTLLSRNGTQNTTDILKNKKFVAIYFSAHWCPPCRQFTPFLAEFYETLREDDENALEIIFASKDEDQATFDESFGDMPWKAIPFEGGSYCQELSDKYGQHGIPTLVVLSMHDGAIRDIDARSTIASAKGSVDIVLAKWDGLEGEGKDNYGNTDDDDEPEEKAPTAKGKKKK